MSVITQSSSNPNTFFIHNERGGRWGFHVSDAPASVVDQITGFRFEDNRHAQDVLGGLGFEYQGGRDFLYTGTPEYAFGRDPVRDQAPMDPTIEAANDTTAGGSGGQEQASSWLLGAAALAAAALFGRR